MLISLLIVVSECLFIIYCRCREDQSRFKKKEKIYKEVKKKKKKRGKEREMTGYIPKSYAHETNSLSSQILFCNMWNLLKNAFNFFFGKT